MKYIHTACKHLPQQLSKNSICAFTYCYMLHTCWSTFSLLLQPQPNPDFAPAQPWRPRTPHTCWVLTKKRTAWRALELVEELRWVWVQGELGVLSLVRLGRWSCMPLSCASWRRYSSLRWRDSWSESSDWSCKRSMEPSRIMESEGEGRARDRQWQERSKIIS